MRVLLLCPYPERLAPSLAGADVRVTMERIGRGDVRDVDWLVSYGYRHILREDVLFALPRRCINLHVAYLPWGRGAHPNFWSWVDDTPKGVTVHQIDAGVDTGPILAQRIVAMSAEMTFRQTQDQLMAAMEALFAEAWPDIRDGNIVPSPQIGSGSHHYARQLPCIPGGWDCQISDYISLTRQDHDGVRADRLK